MFIRNLEKNKKLNKLIIILLLLILKGSLDALYITYIQIIHDNDNYRELFAIQWDYIKYIESWILLLILTYVLPDYLKRPSDIFCHVLGIGILLPMFILFGLRDEERWIVYSVMTGFCIILLVRRGRTFKVIDLNLEFLSPVVISSIALIIVMAWVIYSGGVNYINFNLMKVYEYREVVGNTINKSIFSYLNVWAVKVFNLFLLSYFLLKKKYCWVILVFVFQVLLFGISAHKSVLFYPFLILGTWALFIRYKTLTVIPFFLLILVLITTLLWMFTSVDLPASLFIRRLFFVPASNVYDYYNYFSVNPKVYWSNSILSSWLQYPYDTNYPILIGQIRGLVGYVNAGFLATGYMHAGILGLLFYCFIVGLIFRVIDSFVNKKIPIWFAVSCVFAPIFSLLRAADLPTSLLTHGIIISLVLLYLSRNNE